MRAWRATWVLGGLLLVLGTSCASDGPDVGAIADPLAEFPAQATWTWDPSRIVLPKDDRLDPGPLDARLRQLIGEAFAKRGYREVSGPVNYFLSYELRLDNWVSRTEARSIGSLSVLMVEAASKRRVWLGFVRAEIEPSISREQRDQRLRAELDRMLAEFPPTPRH